MNLRFPYQFDGRGRTAEADEAAYIRDLIEQVLFTAPGERVNRPDFGCGLHAARLRAEQPRARRDHADRWCRARCSSGWAI